MIIYEITAIVDARLTETYERYMRRHHIPDVMASGCFQSADLASATPDRYRIRYAALTNEDFASHFPEEVVLSRAVWTTMQRWDG